MARGNWKPEVIKPRAKCRLCGYSVGPKDFVRLEGIFPAHRACATEHGRDFTEGTEVHPKPKQPEDITEVKSPGSRNEFARKARKAKIPLQMDNKDYGKKSKAVAVTYDLVNSETGEYYGSKTIMTKESKLTFTNFLITEGDDDEITTLPEVVIKELRGLIKKGAIDLQQNWRDALELTDKAYHVGNVRKPLPDQKGAWKQYTDLIAFGVQQLASVRGRDGKWRRTDPVAFSEAAQPLPPAGKDIGKHRFFVKIPGQAQVESEVDNMDEIIEQLTNKLRRNGAKLRVEQRTKYGAKLSIWVGDVKRDEIVVQEIS